MRVMMQVTKEHARAKLAERRARLATMIEVNAPPILIEEERRLVREAVYAVETGELAVQR